MKIFPWLLTTILWGRYFYLNVGVYVSLRRTHTHTFTMYLLVVGKIDTPVLGAIPIESWWKAQFLEPDCLDQGRLTSSTTVEKLLLLSISVLFCKMGPRELLQKLNEVTYAQTLHWARHTRSQPSALLLVDYKSLQHRELHTYESRVPKGPKGPNPSEGQKETLHWRERLFPLGEKLL